MKTVKRIDISSYYQLGDKKLFKLARSLFKENNLHESVRILKHLEGRGYQTVESRFLLARNYDRISFVGKDVEYEDLAQKTYEELLNQPMKKRAKREIEREYYRFMNRVYEYTDTEYNAMSKASRLKELKTNNPKAWVMLGSNFNIRKDVDFVIHSFKRALDLDPNYILALFRIAYLYQYNKNDERTALHYYVRLVKIDPSADTNESETTNAQCVVSGCNELGRIFFRRREYRKVVALFSHALKVHNALLPGRDLSLIRDLIYMADIAATHINIKSRLDAFLRKEYHLSFPFMLHKYCKNISIA